MNSSDMTKDTIAIRTTASLARKGAHKLDAENSKSFFAPAKKMNPSDMTEDTIAIRTTASLARKGAHKPALEI